jgi:hypothetical protein
VIAAVIAAVAVGVAAGGPGPRAVLRVMGAVVLVECMVGPGAPADGDWAL